MTRHWLVILGWFIVASCFAADARSEDSPKRDSLSARIAALGHAWTGDETPEDRDTKAGPRKPPTTAKKTSPRESIAPKSERGLLSHIDPRALIPSNLFGRGDDEPRETEKAVPQSERKQPPSTAARSSTPRPPAARTAARPRVGSVARGDTFRDGFTLPGLGSPTASTANRSAARSTYRSDGQKAASDADDPTDDAPIELNSARLGRHATGSHPKRSTPRPNDDITPIGKADPEAEEESSATEPDVEEPVALPASKEAAQADPDTVAATPLTGPALSTSSGAAAEAFASDSQQPTGPTASSLPATPSMGSGPVWGQAGITDDASDVLVANQTPVITSDIRGPKQILIGREATYCLQLHNDGDVPANELVASIRVPSWADVVDTTASRGTIEQSQDSRTPGGVQWQIQQLDAHASETLNLKLIPRASRPLELGVTWTCAPVGSRAVVEVQEPKLRMHVSGPDEVLFGKPQIYRLTLTNPGTGIAENVKIDLYPPGGGDDAVSTHPMGNIPPGTSQSVEIELTARDAGKLYVKAMASADGGLSSDAAKEIFCRKPELQVDWRGPETKYAGTMTTYFFRVRNPGTATAEDVTVVVTLPEGMEFSGASEGQMFDAQRRTVTWRVGSLGPGDDCYMELKGAVRNPGINQLRVSAATAAGDLSDSKIAETNVIALADLTLHVSDPPGAVAVGSEAIYEIRVENCGANSAEQVQVVALFSKGIEPEMVEGALYSITDGRVTFRPIEKLPAGRQIVLRIRAKGTEAGNHVFRAEVLCKDLDIKLAAEETTRFFADQFADGPTDPAQRSANASDGFEPAVR